MTRRRRAEYQAAREAAARDAALRAAASRAAGAWLVLPAVVCAGAISVVMNVVLMDHALGLPPPGNALFCAATGWGLTVLLFSGFFVSVAITFMAAVVLMWMVAPVRRAVENASSRAGWSFVRVQLWGTGCAIGVVVVGLSANWDAQRSRVCLSDSEIYYQPGSAFPIRSYGLSEVREMRLRCRRGRAGWTTGLEIAMTDGNVFELGPPSEQMLRVLRTVPSGAAGCS